MATKPSGGTTEYPNASSRPGRVLRSRTGLVGSCDLEPAQCGLATPQPVLHFLGPIR